MPTASREIFKDDSPSFTGTHDGADGASDLRDTGAMFKALGVNPDLGQQVHNTTQSTSGAVTASTMDTINVDGVTWNRGDSYEVYLTDTKNSFIAGQWCDVSRGWRILPGDDIAENGWRREDYDIDEPNRRRVFGPGQPE